MEAVNDYFVLIWDLILVGIHDLGTRGRAQNLGFQSRIFNLQNNKLKSNNI